MTDRPPVRVLWLPADPAEGSASMDRHWREVDALRRRQTTPDFEFSTPFAGQPPAATHRAGRLWRGWRKYAAYPWEARRAATGTDIVHILDHSFAHLLNGMPSGVFTIVTVHDVAPLRHDSGLTDRQLKRFRRTMENLRRADLLLADSHHTANDAVEILGCSSESIQVLPLGVAADKFAQAQPAPAWWHTLPGQAGAPRRPVIFSVGSTVPRKNLESLPAIFAAMKRTSPPPPVLVRVGEKLSPALAARIQAELGADGLIERGAVSEAELAAIYQHLDALIFPSRLEGFGLPILEAMAAGCPVVSSNASSLPEVGGEAALYFAPDDAAAAAAHLLRLSADPSFRQEQIRLGRLQAAKLSWGEHYRRLLDVYRAASKTPLAQGAREV